MPFLPPSVLPGNAGDAKKRKMMSLDDCKHADGAEVVPGEMSPSCIMAGNFDATPPSPLTLPRA